MKIQIVRKRAFEIQDYTHIGTGMKIFISRHLAGSGVEPSRFDPLNLGLRFAIFSRLNPNLNRKFRIKVQVGRYKVATGG